MKIVICWSQITGYTAAGWRALAGRPDVDLSIIALKSGSAKSASAFTENVAAGLNHRFLSGDERNDGDLVARLVIEANPEVVVLCGWFHAPYNRLIHERALSKTKFVMGMDTPWQGTWRQRFGRLKVGKLLDRMDRLVVAGERSWQLARALKVPERKIRRGVYGIDFRSFSGIHDRRQKRAGGWPKKFLFVGRYAPEKGLDTLLAAYQLYRQSVPDPWTLSCCGMGPLSASLAGVEGVEDLGFVQPHLLPEVFSEHGVFVIASRFDPWPLVVLEAAAAGLPVICTEACGSGVEVVRAYFNGFTVATDDANALAQKMLWMHLNHELLSDYGLRGISLASAYSAEVWSEAWHSMLSELVAENSIKKS